jgi:hypothetical protein
LIYRSLLLPEFVAPNDHVHRARDVPRSKIDKPVSRAPVQQLLGTIVCQKRFGLDILARCFTAGLFSPLSFYVEALFTSLTDDSTQGPGIDTPPSSMIVSAQFFTRIRRRVP